MDVTHKIYTFIAFWTFSYITYILWPLFHFLFTVIHLLVFVFDIWLVFAENNNGKIHTWSIFVDVISSCLTAHDKRNTQTGMHWDMRFLGLNWQSLVWWGTQVMAAYAASCQTPTLLGGQFKTFHLPSQTLTLWVLSVPSYTQAANTPPAFTCFVLLCIS